MPAPVWVVPAAPAPPRKIWLLLPLSLIAAIVLLAPSDRMALPGSALELVFFSVRPLDAEIALLAFSTSCPELMTTAPVFCDAVFRFNWPEPDRVMPPVPVIVDEIVLALVVLPLAYITASLSAERQRAAADAGLAVQDQSGRIDAIADGERLALPTVTAPLACNCSA